MDTRNFSIYRIISLVVIFLLYSGAAGAVNLQEGEWENVIEVVVEGMPFSMPPTKTNQCITKNDLIPKSDNDKNCTMKEQKVSGNTVRWVVLCKDRDGTSEGKGEITYTGGSYKGTIKMKVAGKGEPVTNMMMKMSGKRVGPCSSESASRKEQTKKAVREAEKVVTEQKRLIADQEASIKKARDIAATVRVPEELPDSCDFTPDQIEKTIACERRVGELNLKDGEWEVVTETVTKMIVAGKEHFMPSPVEKRTTCLTADDPLPVRIVSDSEAKRGKDRITWTQRSASAAMGVSSVEEETGGVIYTGSAIEGGVIKTVTSGKEKLTTITKIKARRVSDGGEGCGRNYTARKMDGRSGGENRGGTEDVMQNPVKSIKKLFGW